MKNLFSRSLLVFFLLLVGALGHTRWIWPVPRSNNPGIKTYPCGPNPFFGPDQTVNLLPVGNLVVHWEETVCHRGAPFRIALSVGDDTSYDDFVLIDHIPHNDEGICNPPKPYSFNLSIPDIDCPRCSLQIIQVMTDKIGDASCCPYPTGDGACFSVYHSCANVVIYGKDDPSKYRNTYTGPCGPYTQEHAEWVVDGDTNRLPPSSPVFRAVNCTGFELECSKGTP